MKNQLFLIVFSLLNISNLSAQNSGQIVGTVLDAQTGETLIGVNVLIEGTSKGTATNFGGYFQLDKLEAGVYNLKISYLAFETQVINGIEITKGESVQVEIILHPQTEVLGDVIVSAEAMLNSEAGLLKQRQKSISFNDAISSEFISQSGSGNAAEAMTKVTGASVVDGKYVYIRGLGERYSSTHLNGAELPSADPEKKSFQLDLFPSSLLENLVTIKTFTPDRPGNFSGGIVDISTVDFPETVTLELSASTTYNTLSTSEAGLLDIKTSSDWLAKGASNRKIPDIFNDSNLEIPSQQSARSNEAEAQLLDQISSAFDVDMVPQARTIPVNQSYSVAFGSVAQLFGKDLGMIGSFTYGQSFSTIDNGVNGTYSLIGNVEGSDSLNATQVLNDKQGEAEVNWGGMASLSYKLQAHHHISAKYLQTQSGISNGRFLEGFWTELGSAMYQSRVSSYSERGLQSLQFKGDHYFPYLSNLEVKWNGSVANNYQDEPDLKYFTNRVSYVSQLNQMVYSDLGGNNPPPTRYFRYLNEQNINLNIDFELPIELGDNPTSQLKFGGSYLDTEREFRQRRFDYERGNGFRLVDYTLEHGPDFNGYFSKTGIIGVADNGNYLFGNLIREAVSEKNNYDGLQQTKALYAMAELYVTEKLRLVGGARIEDTNIKMISFDEDLPEGELNDTDILPSISLIYGISDKMNVRLAYTNTIARPTFRELAPYSTFSFRGDYVFQGNSNLRRTLISNFDIRWEWFPKSGEIFAISGFYKEFDSPLERVIRADIGNKTASIQNVERAELYGIEIEARKRLDDIASFLKSFELGANLSLVHSAVEIPETELIEIRLSDPDPKAKRQLQGQSPYIYNINLTYYDQSNLGLIATASFNKFGDRLSSVARGATPNLFERGYSTLNLTLNKSIGSHLSLNLAAKNLLDPEIKISQKFKEAEFINESYKTGRSFSFGVKYSF